MTGCYCVEHRTYGTSLAIGTVYDSVGGTTLSARGGNIEDHTAIGANEGCVLSPGSHATLTSYMWTKHPSAGGINGYHLFPNNTLSYNSGFVPAIAGTTPTNPYLIGGASKTFIQLPFYNTNNGVGIVLNQ